jgi:hypothetical protein
MRLFNGSTSLKIVESDSEAQITRLNKSISGMFNEPQRHRELGEERRRGDKLSLVFFQKFAKKL